MLVGLLILFFTAGLLVLLIGSLVLAHQLTHPPRRTAGSQLAHGLPIDPADLDLPFTTAQVPLSTGPRDVWLITGHDPAGPIVLLLHGWADSRLGSLLWVEPCRPAASTIALFDRTGHGETPGICDWSDGEAREVLEVVRWLREMHAGRPVVLVGFSMGAAVAIEAAAMASAQAGAGVAGVVADSPYRSVRDVVGRVLKNRGVPPEPMLSLALMWMGLRAGWRRLMRFDAAGLASRMACPLLVIHGTEDHLASEADMAAIAGANPQAERESFDGADHLEPMASEPERYAQRLTDFIRRCGGTSPG